MPLQAAFALNWASEDPCELGCVIQRVCEAQRGRENAVRLIPEMQDHERGVELNRKRSRDRRHFDADRFDIIADLDREGRASDPEIPRELTHPGFYSVRGHDQVIDQGPGTERRDPGEFEREIWREAFLARPCQHCAIGVTCDPGVRIGEVRAVEPGCSQQRFDAVTQ